jgi:nucleoid-associated protein YgaU
MGFFDMFNKKDEKPSESKPDFSNVRSGGSSTAPAEPQPTGTTGSGKTYVVVNGDSLSKIAKREYGDANKWRTIYEANKDLIDDPDLIYPGQELKVPGA